MTAERIAVDEMTTAEMPGRPHPDTPPSRTATHGDAALEAAAHEDVAGGSAARPPRLRAKALRRNVRAARRDGSETESSAIGKRMQGDIGALRALRAAPSPMVPLAHLADEACAACAAVDLQVSRYPAYKSPVFAGRLLLQCRCCGLAWVPGNDLDLEQFYANEYSAGYRAERGRDGAFYSDENPVWSQPVHKVRDRARRQADTLARHGPFARVLDIGAGEGMFLHALPAAEKWAVEPDRHGRRILDEELGVRLTTLPEAALGRAGGPFDLVTASHVLEHLMPADLVPTLEAARAALRPGGLFFVEVPAGAEQLIAFAAGRRPPRARMEPHTLFFSALSLVRLVRQAGFDVLELGPCDWSGANVPGNVLREIAGGAELLSEGPMTVLARAP